MGFFRKIGRAVSKAAKSKVGRAIGRALAAKATLGASEIGMKVAKGLGAFKPKKLPNITPTSVTAAIDKYTAHVNSKIQKMPKASTMPGGAPLTPKPKLKRGRAAGRVPGTRNMPVGGMRPQRKRRTAPAGGKDFKALSAAWKAAGKPGTWREWVSSH